MSLSEVAVGRPHLAVVGSGRSNPRIDALAESVGQAVAEAGAVLVCGGLGGVMEAACRGARSAGGLTIGILPGTKRHDANPHVMVGIPTAMGEARNALVVGTADAVIAVGGEYGTLSEIALALRAGTPVVGLGTWELRRENQLDPGIVPVDDPVVAVTTALQLSSP